MTDEANRICFICKAEKFESLIGDQGVVINCPRCGKYRIEGGCEIFLEKFQNSEPSIKISGWVSDENRKGLIPTITNEAISSALSRPIPTVAERADRLLLEALHNLNYLGSSIDLSDPRFVAATYSRDVRDVRYLRRMLEEYDYIRFRGEGSLYTVHPGGHIRAQTIRQAVGTSSKAFVAMWFGKNLVDVYNQGFDPGIRNAGYDPVRIDHKEHTNKIDDEIIAEIRSSAFVVADFTGHRGGVYFEAGFALGLNLPVIWTCCNDDMKGLHFDIRQYNVIDWVDATDLARRLEKRILATIGKHPDSV